MSVIVYTLRNCEVSDKAVTALRERGLDIEERRVDENATWWEEALDLALAVPIIVWEDGRVETGWEGEHG
ncbi:MAG TPA: glutaredoxin domain-containing protein [Dehalococcoidia bacterium]|nr:glutaredoxin domain-containing protein [Dehalococcoidia bacterium]